MYPCDDEIFSDLADYQRIENITRFHLTKLHARSNYTFAHPIKSPADCQDRTASTPKGRAELQSDSGINRKLILEWVNQADLLRIKGIGSEFSNLLVKAGIHTVEKLADRKPEELHRFLARKNSALGNQVGRLPGQDELKVWIQQARMLASAELSGPGGGRPGGGRRRIRKR